SYTGCFTFLKWFELLQEEYQAPVIMLQVPYGTSATPDPEAVKYVVKQLEETVIPQLEKITGKRFDADRLSEQMERSRRAEDLLVKVLETGKRRPSPIDAYFGAVYYVGPMFTSFRGSEACLRYYEDVDREVAARIAAGEGPPTPSGSVKERFRLVV